MREFAPDVIVIGSGAGGSAVAWKLSSQGYKVCVLEKGPQYRREDFVHDELIMRDGPSQFVPSIRDDPHVVVNHSSLNPSPKLTDLGWAASCVGGGTAHMGATLHRFHPADFRARELLGPYFDVADWPYRYSHLEPYYSEAEWLIGISGDALGGPKELHRSRPYPMPALPSHDLGAQLDLVCAALHLHPFRTPRGINSVAFNGRPACEHCDCCSGFGCPVGARASSQETLLAFAQMTGKCVILPNAMVTQLTTDHTNRVTSVHYIDALGAEHSIRAPIVCVSCGAIESARLLLLCAGADHPNGLANGTGLVGRFLQFHTNTSGFGIFDVSSSNHRFADAESLSMDRVLMDYYFLPPSALVYPKGGLLAFHLQRPRPLAIATDIALGVTTGTQDVLWGRELKRALKHAASSTLHVSFEVFHDGIANDLTYVDLDPTVKDKWGLPVARIHYRALDHYNAAGGWIAEHAMQILRAMGAARVGRRSLGIPTSFMTNGTCRAGTDTTTSVLDAYCRTHEIRNLFVVDGSFMPSSGGAPTTLTITANGLRVGDYIARRAQAREF